MARGWESKAVGPQIENASKEVDGREGSARPEVPGAATVHATV